MFINSQNRINLENANNSRFFNKINSKTASLYYMMLRYMMYQNERLSFFYSEGFSIFGEPNTMEPDKFSLSLHFITTPVSSEMFLNTKVNLHLRIPIIHTFYFNVLHNTKRHYDNNELLKLIENLEDHMKWIYKEFKKLDDEVIYIAGK